MIDKYCDKNIEYLCLGLRPFYLPREIPYVIVNIVYIPPDADYLLATDKLVDCTHKTEDKHPDAVNLILGDFNQCIIDEHLPLFEQYVKCPTRGDNVLDKLYCNFKDSYKILQKPPLGSSDHCMLQALPKYKQKLKSSKPIQITKSEWSEESTELLRGCFDCTDWDALYNGEDNIEDNVDVITEYIKFCANMIIPTKTVKCYPNNKPWVTKDLKVILNEKKEALSKKLSKDKVKDVNTRLKSAIEECKRNYKNKIESLFKDQNTKSAWNGLKCITGYNKKCSLPEVENDYDFAEELNTFYARFDNQDFSKECEELVNQLLLQHDDDIIFTPKEVVAAFSKINPSKSHGPDQLGGKILKECKHQLSSIVCKLYQVSMDEHIIPKIWLTSELVPVPKMPLPEVKNDLRPIALTAILMKCFERIVMKHLNPGKLVDNLQFAYQEGRSVEDATLFLLHTLQSHLDGTRTYARVLFIDFSSAFNTIQPHLMIQKLINKGVNSNLVLWIHKFLTSRIQYVRFKNEQSSSLTINTGAPQGCVLSAGLFTLYTSDKESSHDKCKIIKYADDTVIIGLFNDADDIKDNFYMDEISQFASWCQKNHLDLNVKKTKEMSIDFRIKKDELPPVLINNQPVETVETYKYLGTVIDNNLNGRKNAERIYKKAIQRLYFVRKLKYVNVDKTIISLFYKSVLETVMSFCIVCWYSGCTQVEKRKLNRIISSAKRLGCKTYSLQDLYNSAITKILVHILRDSTHTLFNYFHLLPSGFRLMSIYCRTNRYKLSFVPTAIRSFNKSVYYLCAYISYICC